LTLTLFIGIFDVMTDDEELKLIHDYPGFISYIANPREEVQLVAIRKMSAVLLFNEADEPDMSGIH